MHILTVVGARPQFIKAAVVSRAIAADAGMRETLVHTGQHFDDEMSGVFFEELGIPAPDINLGVHSSGHGQMTGSMLAAIEPVLQERRPDAVLVYGDTNSTLAGALAAVKLNIPVAHVEAGLRSFNRRMPEEINRILTDHASRLLFAPTAAAVGNLALEGISGERVAMVGDVMYDATLAFRERAARLSTIRDRLSLAAGDYALCTIHRAENTGDIERLSNIVAAVSLLSQTMRVVLPLHPRTRAVLEETGLLKAPPSGLSIVKPLGYLDMVCMEAGAALIVTDSGGVQKEAYFHRVPCVTLRDETEWRELVDAGWNRLAPPRDAETMVRRMLDAVGSRGKDLDLYGDGNAAQRVAAGLKTA